MRKSRDYRRLLWRRHRSVNSQCFIISSRTWARPLTEGEIALASLLLRDAIDYSRVRIHARRYMPFQPKNCCMTSNGSMYFHHSCFLDDYSQANLTGQHWFMHEMVLLWQFAHQTLARRGGRLQATVTTFVLLLGLLLTSGDVGPVASTPVQ